MSKVDIKTIGEGEDAFVVNQKDYDDGFPLNKNIREKVAEVELELENKAKAAKAAKAKKLANTKAAKEKKAIADAKKAAETK